jgi:hypothetical protein
MKLEFFFDRKFSNINFMTIGPAGAELFHADGQTDRHVDMTKLIVAFRNLANVPKNELNNYFSKSHLAATDCNFWQAL